ncbi:ribonuclease HII [Kineosphaera limosa]|uniref:ribonuclease HII n=1 Tax=Kineosphaera limosa TaxID=111564 RepID=UPI0023ED606B|nr:ribonuclease HII [Kineosphaera limosa]
MRVERDLQRQGYRLVAGMDEVGRGALAGPVSVGVVVIDEGCRSAPTGLKDSKLLPARRREELVAPVRRWALAFGVGHASAAEIDAVGIMAALRLAGRRALAAAGVRPDVIVLDGNHDWLTDPRREGLLGFTEPEPAALAGHPATEVADASEASESLSGEVPLVRTLIKGDMRCSSVAGASVLAKVERDAMMVSLAAQYPEYGWVGNKGYAATEHRAALLRLGACELHRRSWNLLAAPTASDPEGDEPKCADDGPEKRGCDTAGDSAARGLRGSAGMSDDGLASPAGAQLLDVEVSRA